MREILFRGKNKKGEWVEGAYYKQTEFYSDDFEAHYIISSTDELEDNMMFVDRVIPETVGQYTGLTDKNGKRIFEGDIVKMIYKDDIAEIGPIMWSDVGLRYKFASSDGTSYSFDCTATLEVIGNIHDNPDLLKGE